MAQIRKRIRRSTRTYAGVLSRRTQKKKKHNPPVIKLAMEAVRAFNNELSSLYESKPPVSRAKMAQVTKFAIKAIKFYKHVVQSVEKFIQKCKPEYKVPGLYVIDSIVRQSRHQFGPEKDVFSPRFTKNIVTTFTHLFKCAVEERSRVVRVLNLWQKNCVFSMEIIQPLLDLAADPDNAELVSAAQTAVDSVVSSSQKVPLPGLPEPQPSSNGGDTNSSTQILQQTEMLSTITKLLKEAQAGTITNRAPETQLQQLQNLQQQLAMQTERISKPQQQSPPPIDSNLLAQIQVLTNQLLSKPGGGGAKAVEITNNQNSVAFNKKLLDFDYGDSDEDEDKEDHQQQHSYQPHHQQQRQPAEVSQQVIPKVLDQNIHHKVVLDQNILSKIVPDRNILPNVVLDQNILSKIVPDRNILPNVVLDQNILSKIVPDRNILPNVVLDQNMLSKIVPDRNILPNVLLDQNMLSKIVPDPNILPKMVPDQNINHKVVLDQNMLSKIVPDRNILPNVVLDQNILPKVVPDQNIHHKVVLDQNILPKVVPDQNILSKFVPDQNILPKVVLDQNILPKVVPDQNILQQIQQMSQQQEQLQSENSAHDQFRKRLLEQQQQLFDREIEQESLAGQRPTQGFNQDQDRRQDIDQDDRENNERAAQRRQRNSRDRSPRRRSRRSRSRSRDRDRDRRRRSRSRDRHRRSRSRDRERREKERERRKVGLPPLKSNNIAICSTTIWFGRLTKSTTEEELTEYIEKYGTIRTILMIPPRGCAFVCVTKRKDASKIMDRLKGIKINGSAIKVAWAPGIGVKESVFKNSWDVDLGVTYIPWEKLPKDIAPLLVGGMVDEESLPERLKGIKTGEEDEEVQPDPPDESEGPHEDSMESQQQPPQVPLGMPGLANFPLPGQNPMALMGPGGPLSLLSGPPPPIGIRPGMGTPLMLGGPNNAGSPNTMLGHNSVGLSNNMSTQGSMGNLHMTGLIGPPPNLPGMGPNLHGMGPNLHGMRPNLPGMGPNLHGMGPNLHGMGPNLPGMGPRPINMGPPQGSMLGGQGNSMSCLGGPHIDTHSSQAGVNSPGPRGPFGHFARFPHMQGPAGIHSFVNSNIHGDHQSVMGDSDMRAMAEPKEWPPDDEVNAEDESDDDHHMDSDERILPMGRQQHMPGPGMPNLQALGNPFGLHGPIIQGQGPPNSMLGIPRAPSPNTGMPSIISLRMMPPRQQPPVITISGGSAPGFPLAPGRIRLSMPTVGVGPGLLPVATSPHLIAPSPGTPLTVAVSVNGSVVVTRPGLPASSTPISAGVAENPPASTEGPSSEEDKLVPHTPGPVSLMQIHGGNRAPVGPILGRGFAPMTIRPRGGPGLLGVRPGAHGGGGFNRFVGSRPLIAPVFGEMDRPPFGNRFGVPLRPPVGFLDQDEREDRDERRPLPRIDVDEDPGVGSVIDQSIPKDIDERKDNDEEKDKGQDIDMRQDIDERPKSGHASGRQSRWRSDGGPEETSTSTPIVEGKATDNASGDTIAESGIISTPSVVERLPAAIVVQPVIGVPSAPVLTKIDSVSMVADVSIATQASVLDGEGAAVQSS